MVRGSVLHALVPVLFLNDPPETPCKVPFSNVCTISLSSPQVKMSGPIALNSASLVGVFSSGAC